MHVLVVHNRYASAQPSGRTRSSTRRWSCCARPATGSRCSSGAATTSPPGPCRARPRWRSSYRGTRRSARNSPPGCVPSARTWSTSTTSSRSCRPRCWPPAPTPVCPPSPRCTTTPRSARPARCNGTAWPCTECVGSTPLPAVRHGCYRNSRLATVPLAVSLSVNRRRWWSGVERFFCISAAQRDVLVRSGMPAERLAVKHNFVPEPDARRAGDGEHLLYLGRLAEAKGVRLLMAAWDEIAASGGVGVPLVIAWHGATGAGGDRLGGGPGRRALRRPVRPGAVPSGHRALGRRGGSLDLAGGVRPGGRRGDGGRGADRGRRSRCLRRTRGGRRDRLPSPAGRARLARVVHTPDRGRPAGNREMGRAARRRYEQGFSPAVGLERLVEGYRTAIAGRSGGGDSPPPVGTESMGGSK